MKASNPVEDFVGGCPKNVVPIINKLRCMVRNTYPEAQEILYHDALGYSPTGQAYDRIIYVWPSKNHVTLGFFFGTSISDPDHLLVGEGKRMRHVKVKTEDEVNDPALRKLVQSARATAKESLESLHEGWTKHRSTM